jgi:sugar phosphate isomerase/epimerase
MQLNSVELKNYRGRFPFRLATTSYIYPDEIVTNVARLAPYFDEIELVLFESRGHNRLPDQAQIDNLVELSRLHRVGFNIHLPIDLSLGDESEEERSHGTSVVKMVIERTLCLDPSLYTLHLDLKNPPPPPLLKGGEEGLMQDPDIEDWRLRLIRSMEEILSGRIEPKRISIETLEYPFEWIEDIVRRFGFSICLDVGHILGRGDDLNHSIKRYLPRVSIIHLHGFQNGRDHLGIDKLPEPVLIPLFSSLRHYHGTVSIEVFSIDELKNSLDLLEEKWIKG